MTKIITITMLVFFVYFNAAFADEFKIYVLKSEPLGYINAQGKEVGTHWDYMKAIADRSGIKMNMKLAPKARVFYGVKEGTIDAAIFFRSKKLDNQVEYVAQIRSIKLVAINRKGLPLNNFQDLKNSSAIGKMRSTFLGKKFDDDPMLKVVYVNNYDSMIKMLGCKRIDTATGNSNVLAYLINKYSFHESVESPGITLGVKEQWLQISKKSKKLSLIPRLKEAIQELQEEGVFDQILAKNVGSRVAKNQ